MSIMFILFIFLELFFYFLKIMITFSVGDIPQHGIYKHKNINNLK